MRSNLLVIAQVMILLEDGEAGAGDVKGFQGYVVAGIPLESGWKTACHSLRGIKR